MDLFYILLGVFIITGIIGTLLGLYLSSVCTKCSDDEEYETDWIRRHDDLYKGK